MAQLTPVYFREPSVNIGVGDARGQPPHITGKDFLKHFGFADEQRVGLRADRRRISKLWPDPMAALVGSTGLRSWSNAFARSAASDKVLFLDGGDTWQGSLGANSTRGQDMVDCMALLKPDAMTGHWEFTYGEARVKELIKGLGYPFLALNIRDTEWNEPAFEPMKMFEKGGVKDRRPWSGVSLHASGKSALDDAEMVIRYP